MINVTRAFLPEFEEYSELIKGIWENNHLTNRGPLVQRLEKEICEKMEEIKQDLQSAISYAGGCNLGVLNLNKVAYGVRL